MIESLECRRLFAGFDDLLTLASSGGNGGKQGFSIDDAIPVRTGASLSDGRVIIAIGSDYGDRANTFSATVSKKGIVRFFDNGTQIGHRNAYWNALMGSGPTSFEPKLSDISSVEIRDYRGATRIKLDESFPEATVYLKDGNDFFRGNSKSNIIYGEKGNDTIYAGGGDDLVYGGEGNDLLFGEGGNDKLLGDAHKDILDGGKGKNELIGGQGTDSFIARAKDKVRREDRDRVKVID